MVTFKGANLITVTFQTKPHWPPGHRELAFLRTFNFHATTGAVNMATGTRGRVLCPGRICSHLRLTMLPAFAITAPYVTLHCPHEFVDTG